MNSDLENVRQARESFDRILHNPVYASVIRDDKHLTILMDLIKGSRYNKILDIGTGTGYLAFPLAGAYPYADIYGIDIAESMKLPFHIRICAVSQARLAICMLRKV